VSGQLGESGNDLGHEITRLMERFDNRLTLSNLRLAERYMKGEINVLIRLCIRGINEDYVACFQRTDSLLRSDVNVCGDSEDEVLTVRRPPQQATATVFQVSSVPIGVQESQRSRDGCQLAVFIDQIECVESPENRIASLVWLAPLNALATLWADALYFFPKVGLFSLGRVKDWECREASRTRHESVDEVIKGASQVLQHIASDRRERGGRIGHLNHAIEQLSRIRIALGPEFIGVCVTESDKLIFEFRDVLFGPFNFGRRTADIAGHGHFPHSGK